MKVSVTCCTTKHIILTKLLSHALEGIKNAQQTMTAMKAANKELKGMMKTVRIEDIDSMQDETTDVMDVSNEIQETLGRSYNVPDEFDEEELMGGMTLIAVSYS
uniref:Uncharacterized protein n=1 Tax=Triticum urartu TaxID=4572 RepID=A0A8R7JU20_TRIUA